MTIKQETEKTAEIPSDLTISLIGYRGAGKTAIADTLMKRLGRYLISTDGEMEKKKGMTIPEIRDQLEWPGFRELESQICRDVSNYKGVIIDCGGGVVEKFDSDENIIENTESINNLKRNSIVVWLTASEQTMVDRIKGDANRPPLVNGKTLEQEVHEVLTRRTPFYNHAADLKFATDDGSTVEEVVEKIIQKIKELN